MCGVGGIGWVFWYGVVDFLDGWEFWYFVWVVVGCFYCCVVGVVFDCVVFGDGDGWVVDVVVYWCMG